MRIGAYQLGDQVGEGGFARVFRATTPDGAEVAIKVLMHGVDGAGAPNDLEHRFRREIEVLASVRHPNLVALLDHGVDAKHGPWLAMPLLRGVRLRDVMPASGVGPEGALRLLLPVIEAVGAMHVAGLVHRDIKPENVIVSPRGDITLVDLGLALGQDHSRLTRTGAVAGSVPYMAPEQIEGDVPTSATDVFALGGVLYELCCGERAFGRPRSGEEVAAILGGRFTPLMERDRRVAPKLDALVARCLAADPATRPQDGNELASLLREHLDWAPPSAHRREVVEVSSDPVAYQEARAADRLRDLHQRADEALAAGSTFAALALLDRALAYAPNDEATLDRIEQASGARPAPSVDPAARTEAARPSSRPAPMATSRARSVTSDAGEVVAEAAPSGVRPAQRFLLPALLFAFGGAASVGAAWWYAETRAEDAPGHVQREADGEDLAAPTEALTEAPTEAAPDPALTPLPGLMEDRGPLPDLGAVRPIPAAELAGGETLPLDSNLRQEGEPLVPTRQLPGGVDASLQRIDAQRAQRPNDRNLDVGRALVLLGDPAREAEGLRELARLEREHPELDSLWGGLGYVRMRLGDLEGAERAFDRALELDPADAATLRNRGILRHRTGRRELAYDDLRASLRYDPNDVNALSELAQIYERTGHRIDARPLIERVTRLQPRNVEAWIDLSLAQTDADDQLASVDRALLVAPGLPRALKRRCAVLARAQRPTAIEACTAALQAIPDDPWSQMHRGLAHYHAGRDAEALRDMDAAIEARPRDAVMRTNRYLVRQHAGRRDAIADLRVACDLGHENACTTLAGL